MRRRVTESRSSRRPALRGRQLRTLAARIFSQRLDRSKPVWEIWLVDGVEGGRFALVGKTHHCLVDGVSGVDITTVLFDLDREPQPASEADAWLPEPEPSDAQVLAEALIQRATSPAEMSRGVRALLRGPRQATGMQVRPHALASNMRP